MYKPSNMMLKKTDTYKNRSKFPVFQHHHIKQTDRNFIEFWNKYIKNCFGWQKYKVEKVARQEFSLMAYTKLGRQIKYCIVGKSTRIFIEDLHSLIQTKLGLNG